LTVLPQLLIAILVPLRTIIDSLVGGIPILLKNMSSAVGMMKFPTEWKNNPTVPVTTNQQLLNHS